MDQRKRAEALLNKLNACYSDETFVSEGYSYFDDLAQAITFEFTRDAERVAKIQEALQPLLDDWSHFTEKDRKIFGKEMDRYETILKALDTRQESSE